MRNVLNISITQLRSFDDDLMINIGTRNISFTNSVFLVGLWFVTFILEKSLKSLHTSWETHFDIIETL